jgi:hypothetical protein
VFEIAWTYIAISSGVHTLGPMFKVKSRDIMASRKKLVADLKAKALREKQAKRMANALDPIESNFRGEVVARRMKPEQLPV